MVLWASFQTCYWTCPGPGHRPEMQPVEPLGDPTFKPWDLRERIKPLRTYSGRVVYDRPKHYFSLKDAARILETFPKETPVKKSLWVRLWEGLIRIFFNAWNFDKAWVYAVGNTINQLVNQNWEDLAYPWEMVQAQYKDLILNLIAEFQLAGEIRKHFGWKQGGTDGSGEEERN
jgi:hypothetical protein